MIQKNRKDRKIKPSKQYDENAKPDENPTKISKNDDAERVRSLTRENEAAETLAKNGYNIEQNPIVEGTNKNPDYRIEGEVFDCYSPKEGTNVRNVTSQIQRKIDSKQTERVILNLDDWTGEIGDISSQLNNYPIEGLKEVIAVKGGEVINIF